MYAERTFRPRQQSECRQQAKSRMHAMEEFGGQCSLQVSADTIKTPKTEAAASLLCVMLPGLACSERLHNVVILAIVAAKGYEAPARQGPSVKVRCSTAY